MRSAFRTAWPSTASCHREESALLDAAKSTLTVSSHKTGTDVVSAVQSKRKCARPAGWAGQAASDTRITLCRAFASSGSRHCPSTSKPCEGPPIFVAQKRPSSPGASSWTRRPGPISVELGSCHAEIWAGVKGESCARPTSLPYLRAQSRTMSRRKIRRVIRHSSQH
eukprot:6182219-Pleurochrysis_carterae.AAC.6